MTLLEYCSKLWRDEEPSRRRLEELVERIAMNIKPLVPGWSERPVASLPTPTFT
jgi:hypothetical protein